MSSNIKLWWRAVRPSSFPVSMVPALLGITLAWQAGVSIHIGLAFITISGALAIHTATNLLQDYFDFKSGIDRPGSMGGSGVLVEGLLTPRDILTAAIFFFCLSALAALPLVARAGLPLVILIIAGFIAGAGYAIPRKGFKYRAMGDVAVFLAFGIGITLGSYLIQARGISLPPIICAVSFGLLVVGLLHANNMRDLEDDLNLGIRTLAARLGIRGSVAFFIALVVGAYAVLSIGVVKGTVPVGALLTLLTLPIAVPLLRDVYRVRRGERAAMALAWERTAMLSLAFGITMIVGIVLERFLASSHY